jgi:hypothetical protein
VHVPLCALVRIAKLQSIAGFSEMKRFSPAYSLSMYTKSLSPNRCGERLRKFADSRLMELAKC